MTAGDVTLRASVFGMFQVLDAITSSLLAGPMPRDAAFAFARRHGAKNVYHQAVDDCGRVLAAPVHITNLD